MSGEGHEKDTKLVEDFRLGGFSFSLQTNELKDENGNTIHLRSQSTEVLDYLARHHDEIVSRTDLIENVWPDTFVTDDSLAQCIADIRRALNDTDHKIVHTLPKKGYKLEAVPSPTVLPEKAEPTQPVASSTNAVVRPLWLVILIAILLIGVAAFAWRSTLAGFDPIDPASLELSLPDKPSIAVLAFDDHSTGDNRDYLSDAIAEGIITNLSHYPELFVIARNSSFSFRTTATDIREIARILGVRYVLEGSQQKQDNDLRVTVQLVDALEGHHLWSQSYDRELDKLFLVQDDIVRRVVATVAENLIAFEGEKAKTSDISKLTSLLHHLKARRYWREFTREGTEKARLANIAAINADPSQPYGYVGLAHVYINGYRWGWGNLGREESLAEARKSAQMALKLAPNFYESHNAMGYVHTQAGELDRAIARFNTALSLNPNSTAAMGMMAEVLGYYERAEEAEVVQTQAMRLDPLHPDWMKWNLSWLQWVNGKCDAALETMHDISQMPSLAYRTLAIIHVCLDQQPQAEEAIAKLVEHNPGYSIPDVRKSLSRKYKNIADFERYVDGLREAGLPE